MNSSGIFSANTELTDDKQNELNSWWQQVLRDCDDPAKQYRETLLDVISTNANTEYGRDFKFAGIKTYEDFKRLHPLTEWSHYNKYITKMVDLGQENVLTSLKPGAFYISSGTTGPPKFVPGLLKNENDTKRSAFLLRTAEFQQSLMEAFCLTQHPIGNPFVRSLVINTQGVEKLTPDGVRCGAGSSIMTEDLVAAAIEGTRQWKYVTSPYVHLLVDPENANYAGLVFTLQEENLDILTGSFIASILSWFQTLQHRWREIVHDIRQGSIAVEALSDSESTRQYLPSINESLRPNPHRADELTAFFNAADKKGNSFEGISKSLWPNLKIISCLCGGSFTVYKGNLLYFVGNDVALFSPHMLGSEGSYGSNYWPGERESCYAFSTLLNFLEFIPEELMNEADPDTVEIDKLVCGRRYETVLTGYNGLCRYRVGDVIQVQGMLNNMPLFDIAYRRGSLLNIFNEFTSELQGNGGAPPLKYFI